MAPTLLLPIRVTPKTRGARCPARGRFAGFTLIELLVVMAILAVAMLLGIPAIQNLIVRSKTEGFAREVAVSLQRARLEAIKMNRAGAAFLDPDSGQLVVFIDADGALDGGGSRDFAPDPDQPRGSADYLLARLTPPSNVEFRSPDGGGGAVVDFTDNGGNQWLIFRPDGSVVDTGAFRIGDIRGNFLEIEVSPAATGRIRLHKYQDEEWLSTVDPSDPNYKPWKWN